MKCLCGCGNPTTIVKETNRERGWVKGQPVKYISGHNSLGRYLSKETKKRMSLERMGYNNPMFGKKHTLEFKQKLSAIMKNRFFTKEHRHKLSIARLGIKLSEEHKQKLKEARRRYKHPFYDTSIEIA